MCFKLGLIDHFLKVPITVIGLHATDASGAFTIMADLAVAWRLPAFRHAAHAMSSVGGVGANIAVQDAVAAAKWLAAKLVHGAVSEHDLVEVQRRREFPMPITQAMQVIVQNNIVSAALKPGNGPFKPPLFARVINAVPWLQGLTAHFIVVGVRP